MIDKLKYIFGPKCTGVNVNGEITEFINVPSKQMKFCEAINYSFDVPVRFNNENLGCPGARRSVGFDNGDKHLAKIIFENNNIPEQFVRKALTIIPALQGIRHINLGLPEYMEKDTQPDLYILYIHPNAVTAIKHILAKHKIIPSIPPYSLLSVCGNIFANCYINKLVSISFGCPESRKNGGIEKNEVVIGLPFEIAKLIIDSKLNLKQ